MTSLAMRQVVLASARELGRDSRSVLIMLLTFGLLGGGVLVADLLTGGGTVSVTAPLVLTVGLCTIAFTGTSVPLARQRQDGALRVLATTPLTRAGFLACQVPPRLALMLVEIGVVLWVVSPHDVVAGLGFVVTAIVGSAMLVALALLLASRSRNAVSMSVLAGTIPAALALFSGGSPLAALLPTTVRFVLDLVPLSWLSRGLTTADPLAVVAMAGTAGVCFWLAAVRFRWE